MAVYVAKYAIHSIAHMGEKPHSSITDWIEILSSERYGEDEYDGIPELVDAINLQAEGTMEASRAIRKKLKYGNVHRQLRALTILKALVENCGTKFQTSFANDRLTDRIKSMASDSMTDDHVKKKLFSVLGSWHRQFRDDPKMKIVSDLYISCGGGKRHSRPPAPVVAAPTSPTVYEQHQRLAEDQARERAERKEKERREKEEEKRRAKAEKEEKARKEKQKGSSRPKRAPFDFEKEKPEILSSIATASQASNNLVNALKLVNREQESIQANERVQDCLAKTKAARKIVVRYVQLVENEELIGTLLDTNERIITALQMYDRMLKPASQDSDDEQRPMSPNSLAAHLQTVQLTGPQPDRELEKLQEKQRAEIERAKQLQQQQQPTGAALLHPDLRDLSFGPLGNSTGVLPPPLKPSHPDSSDEDRRGSLSDFSDYDSSDEETHVAKSKSTFSSAKATGGGGAALGSRFGGYGRSYEDMVQGEEDIGTYGKQALLDPFDDPFADPSEVGTPGIVEKKGMAW